MRRFGKIYQECFDVHKAKGFGKLLSSFMLTLPHIITCVLLILFFPDRWIGILIAGLVLPDLSYFFHMFVHPGAIFKGDFHLNRIGDDRKKVAHILTFIVAVFFFAYGDFVLSAAAGIHLFLDWLGF